jgi:hypothetical protein
LAGFFAGCILALTLWWRELVKSNPGTETQLQALKKALLLGKIRAA